MNTWITRRERLVPTPAVSVVLVAGLGRRAYAGGVGSPGHSGGRAQSALRRQRRLRVPGARPSRIALVLGTSLAAHAGAARRAPRSERRTRSCISSRSTTTATHVKTSSSSSRSPARPVSRRSRCAVRTSRTTSVRGQHAASAASRSRATSTQCSAIANGIQLFAGPRDDPFFIDLEQFFRIMPDRQPVSGPALRASRSRVDVPRRAGAGRGLRPRLQRPGDRRSSSRRHALGRRRDARPLRRVGHHEPRARQLT